MGRIFASNRGVGLPLPVLETMGFEVGAFEDALNAAAADGGHSSASHQDFGQQAAAPLAVAAEAGILGLQASAITEWRSPGLIRRGRPDRRASSRPAIPLALIRCTHLRTVCRQQPKVRAVPEIEPPSATMSTRRTRKASYWLLLERRRMAPTQARSVGLRSSWQGCMRGVGESEHEQVVERRFAWEDYVGRISASTQSSVRQRLIRRQRERWPQLTGVRVRFRNAFAYVDGVLPDGEVLPLCRLRYGDSASFWDFAIYSASGNRYEDSILPSGMPFGEPREALDCACDLHLNDPSAWSRTSAGDH